MGPLGVRVAVSVALGLWLVTAAASAASAAPRKPTVAKRAPAASRERGPEKAPPPTERKAAKQRKSSLRIAPEHCSPRPITFQRGTEKQVGALLDCKGAPVPETLAKLAVLARLRGSPRPTIEGGDIVPVPGPRADSEVSRGVRRLDPGLSIRLAKVTERYPDRAISVVSGYRPQANGSLHQHGRAMDIQVEGVSNVDLVAFCRTLVDTGCGYYPNSSFVHIDVRKPGTGSVSWIDASGPGEAPRYVKSWPPPADDEPKSAAPADSAGPADSAATPAKHPTASPAGPEAELPDLPPASSASDGGKTDG